MRFSLITLSFGLSFLLLSCGEKTPEKAVTDSSSSVPVAGPDAGPTGPSIQVGSNVEAKAFEVTAEAGKKSMGWGYDLFVNGKRMIHQPIIPAIAGNTGFKTEEQALSVGNLAAARMSKLGSLPTITIDDLDSLGVITHAYADSVRRVINQNINGTGNVK